MRTQKRRTNVRPNKVSFTLFRRLQLAAVDGLLKSPTLKQMPNDVQIIAYVMRNHLRDGSYAQAVALAGTLSKQSYGDDRQHRLGVQLAYFVTKVPYVTPDLDPEGNAKAKFLEAEDACRETNGVFRDYNAFLGMFSDATPKTYRERTCDPSTKTWDVEDDSERMIRLIERAKIHIRRVLGEKPPFAEIWNSCRFSSGAAVGISGTTTHLARKLSEREWTVTPGCIEYATAALAANPYMWEALFGFPHAAGIAEFRDEVWQRMVNVNGDVVTFVTKKADCHRAIAPPPLMNLYVQNGVGDWIRDALRDRANLDIRTAQQRVNGPMARLGSSCEGMPYATLDLSSASDTISIEWVRCLVPREWFVFLNAIRSPMWSFDGSTYQRYEKFAAMGNGFCFALETLLFWSLVQAVYDLNVTPDRACAVYGDDIIVYQSVALELIELLNVCGFETNSDKTFVHGPFRESCGQDYYDGVYVRPVVLDEVIDEWSQVFHFVNSLQRVGYTHLAAELRAFIPDKHKYYRACPGPSHTALEVTQDEFLTAPNNRVRWNKSTHSFSWKELEVKPVRDTTSYDLNKVGMLSVVMGAKADSLGHPIYTYRRRTVTGTRWVNRECETHTQDQCGFWLQTPGFLV